jgi:hypothetical protein
MQRVISSSVVCRTARSQQRAGLELWQQKSFIDLVEKHKASRAFPLPLSLSAALFNAPSPLQALDFVFHLFGDLPDVFAQVLARAQGLQCMHCV